MAITPVNLFARARLLVPHASTLSRIAMPPKRRVTAKKRDDAGTTSESESASQSQPRAKRVKRTETTSDDGKAPNGQPTNKALPVDISFPPRVQGTLRLVTWNVCGLAAAQRKVHALFTRSNGMKERVVGVQILRRGGRSRYPRIDRDEGERRRFACLFFFTFLRCAQVNNEPVDPVISARFPYRTWAISDKKTYGAFAFVATRTRSAFSTLQGAPRYSRKSNPSRLQRFFRDIRTLSRSRGVL